MTATHQHAPSRVKWNWATDRIEHFCACGLKLADDIDEDSYGRPDLEAAYLYAAAGGRGAVELPTPDECGQSWLIDLAFGLAVLAFAFAVALTLLLLT